MQRWRPFEIAAIHALAQREIRAKQAAFVLQRSLDSVYYMNRRQQELLCSVPRWTAYEIGILKSAKTIKEVAEKLARTESAIFNKAKRLGVSLDCRSFFKKRNNLSPV